MKTTDIYTLSDINDNVFYVGQTIDRESRLKAHKCRFGNKIQMEVIDTVSRKEANFYENHYMYLYKSWGFELKNIRWVHSINKANRYKPRNRVRGVFNRPRTMNEDNLKFQVRSLHKEMIDYEKRLRVHKQTIQSHIKTIDKLERQIKESKNKTEPTRKYIKTSDIQYELFFD